MQRVIALVGRPNVGKSTLFNRLTRTRRALVADVPGLTRDRQYGDATIGELTVTLIDTGGLAGDEEGVELEMAHQSLAAMDEADLCIFITDGRAGLTPGDEKIAELLRRRGVRTLLAVNKIDGVNPDGPVAEFHSLGFGDLIPISATHGRGIGQLAEWLENAFPAPAPVGRSLDGDSCDDSVDSSESQPVTDPAIEGDDGSAAESDAVRGITVSVVGRPNVGKSTLVNRILGDERVVVYDQPGTTRDSIFVPLERNGRRWTLVDTAGVRRRGRVDQAIEKFSIIKTLDAIRSARVTLLVIDAHEGLVDQDLHLLGYAIDAGRSIALLVNKWDGLTQDQRADLRKELDRRLVFAPWVEVQFISALHGTGVGKVLNLAGELYDSGGRVAQTSELTRVLLEAVERHPPPMIRGRRIKLRMAHPGGSWPPTVVINGNQTDAIPRAWHRYIENVFRDYLKLRGTPVRVEFRSSDNPYAGRKNPLTPRQERRRKRLVRHNRRR